VARSMPAAPWVRFRPTAQAGCLVAVATVLILAFESAPRETRGVAGRERTAALESYFSRCGCPQPACVPCAFAPEPFVPQATVPQAIVQNPYVQRPCVQSPTVPSPYVPAVYCPDLAVPEPYVPQLAIAEPYVPQVNVWRTAPDSCSRRRTESALTEHLLLACAAGARGGPDGRRPEGC